MAAVEVVMDTGPLVGYLDKSDQWHAFAVQVFPRVKFPAYTCEAVLSEAAFLLRDSQRAREALLELVDSGALVVLPVFGDPAAPAYVSEVLAKYGHKADLADAAMLWLAESLPRVTICTVDKGDFSRYRLKCTGKPPRLLAP